MVNKKNLLLIATVMCFSFASANASNLVQMDIKKTSDSAVDVTFYTTEVSGNPMVTRKSNNKYVILMPNVAGKNAGTPDLSAVKDIITNVDVKNVDDGMSGYTKVTFITTKPINIKTKTQKAAPVTAEESAAKALIAQAKTHPRQVTPTEPKKEVTKTVVTSSSAKTQPKAVQNTPKSASAQPAVQKTNESKPVQSKVEPQKTVEVKPQPVATVEPENKLDIKEVEKIEKISNSTTPKKTANHGWTIILLPLLGLYLLAKLVRNSVQKSNVLKASFRENLAERPYIEETYEDIINDSELNWQERYQKFVAESKGEIKNRKYSLIKTQDTSAKAPEVLNEVDKKRLELESTLDKTPEIYEAKDINTNLTPAPEVKSEDDVISKELKNTIKLKAFAKPASLSRRDKVKHSIPIQPKAKEGKFVKLQKTALNATSRKLQNANLSVSDLITTGNKYLKNEEAEMAEQNYLMSSVEEYFALLDKEQSAAMTNPNADLSRKVAASLAQVKPSMNIRKSNTTTSNPFSSKKSNDKYLNGLVVKSSFNIDENKGFYLVNVDGSTALVGRVNDDVTVIKTFESNVDKLQVRLDSENVYMVKAGDFKSLVDVSENKMGVLIEL